MDVFEGLDPAVRARTKTMLMAFIVFAVVMLFAGFTSAWIVSNRVRTGSTSAPRKGS